MKNHGLKIATVTAAIAASIAFSASAQAAVALDEETFTQYCVDLYGEGATAEAPLVDYYNQPRAECTVPGDDDANTQTAQSVSDICISLTGYDSWVNFQGTVVCTGRSQSQGSERGSFTN
jgi:hypothetical protein